MVIHLHIQSVFHLVSQLLLLTFLNISFVVLLLHLLHGSLLNHSLLKVPLFHSSFVLQVFIIRVNILVLFKIFPVYLSSLKLLVLIF